MVDRSRRSLLGASLAAPLALPLLQSSTARAQPRVPAAPASPAAYQLSMAPGPFNRSPESLKRYHTPDWFRDAKFGIWS